MEQRQIHYHVRWDKEEKVADCSFFWLGRTSSPTDEIRLFLSKDLNDSNVFLLWICPGQAK